MKRLKDKLYNYEVAPPPGAWDKISSELDQSMLNAEFPATLYHLEVQPPKSAWTKIKTALDSSFGTPAPVRRLNPAWRYAAAAVIAGLIFFAGFNIFKSSGSGDAEVATTSGSPVQNNNTPSAGISTPGDNRTQEEIKDDAALEESKHTLAKLEVTRPNSLNKASIYGDQFIARPVNAQVAAFTDLNPENTYRELCYVPFDEPLHEDNLSTSASRYVLLMTPEGNFIRMSKKLEELVCCVAGEDQDPECKDQISDWRKKIAKSAHSSSPGNFMDILNLVKSLQENRE